MDIASAAIGSVTAFSSERLGRWRTPVTLAISSLPLVAAVLLFRPQMQQPWPVRPYLTAHTIVETLVAVVAFATFAVQWYAAGARLGDARARFIGAAFLAVAMFELTHVVAFPGMPGVLWLQSSTERGIVYWLAARVVSVFGLLGALAIQPGSEARVLRRGPLLALAIGTVVAMLVADHLWISRQPLFFVDGQGLTTLKKVLEFMVAGAAAAGVVAYRRVYRQRQDTSSDDLALALGLTVLSELCFALYTRAVDSFNLLGHVYLLFASYGVFHSLFVEAVLRPYERLGATSRALGASNAELQRLREHVEGKLAVTIRNLEALQEQREDLVRAVSHDLRTPLQVVVLQAGALAAAAPAGTREKRAAGAIASAGRQMNALIQDLVDSVHLESGTFQLAKDPVALQSLLPRVLEVAGGPVDTARIDVEIAGDLPVVSLDPNRMQRVVQNLVGNALKYSAPGTRIAVRAQRVGGEVVVSVADRGAGIGPDDLPRIFERFYRGGQNHKAGGLGLGLYISRLIVESHGGRIWCESRLGEGSVFRFALPILPC